LSISLACCFSRDYEASSQQMGYVKRLKCGMP
jgi:hypothetical protein